MVLSCLRGLRLLQVTVLVYNSIACLVHMKSVRLIALHFSPNNKENLVRSSIKFCFIHKATYRYHTVAFEELSWCCLCIQTDILVPFCLILLTKDRYYIKSKDIQRKYFSVLAQAAMSISTEKDSYLAKDTLRFPVSYRCYLLQTRTGGLYGYNVQPAAPATYWELGSLSHCFLQKSM